MIDIEPLILEKVSNAIAVYDPTVVVEGVYNPTPKEFPFVSVEQDSNLTVQRTQSTSSLENHASVTFAFNVYTVGDDRIANARELRDVIDYCMIQLGFIRVMSNPVPNADRNVYRIMSRYSGIVSAGVEVDGDTIFKVYGR